MFDILKSKGNKRTLAAIAAVIVPILHNIPQAAPYLVFIDWFAGILGTVAVGHAAIAGTLVDSVDKQ